MAVVKIIELVGSSKTSTDDAAKQALTPGAVVAAQHPRGRHRLDRDPGREPRRVPRPRPGRVPDRGHRRRLAERRRPGAAPAPKYPNPNRDLCNMPLGHGAHRRPRGADRRRADRRRAQARRQTTQAPEGQGQARLAREPRGLRERPRAPDPDHRARVRRLRHRGRQLPRAASRPRSSSSASGSSRASTASASPTCR